MKKMSAKNKSGWSGWAGYRDLYGKPLDREPNEQEQNALKEHARNLGQAWTLVQGKPWGYMYVETETEKYFLPSDYRKETTYAQRFAARIHD